MPYPPSHSIDQVQEELTMERWLQRAASMVTILPLIAAGLYLAGSAYVDAFLASLGLSSAQFSSSFEGLVLGGFLVMFVSGIWPVLYLIVAIGVVAVVATITAFLLRKRDVQRAFDLDRALRTASSLAGGDTHADRLDSLAERLLNTAIISMGTLLIVTTLILLPAKAGHAAADRFKANAANGASVLADVFIKGAPGPRAGVLAACNESQCAYWFQDHSEIFNLVDFAHVVTRPAVKK
jgi:hypothetical protein